KAALLSPAVLAVFCASFALPRAGLLVHSHSGGDHAHLHLQDGDVDNPLPHAHHSQASAGVWHTASLDVLRAADLHTSYAQRLQHDPSSHDDLASTGSPAEISFELTRAEHSASAARPWYAALVDDHLHRHAPPHQARTVDAQRPVRQHACHGPEFAATAASASSHWHAQLPFHLVARCAPPTLIEVTTVEAVVSRSPFDFVTTPDVPTHVRGPPSAAEI